MNTKNISFDKNDFKMADNYEEFSISLISLNYFKDNDDIIALVELHGDLNIVGYAIVWGFDDEIKGITATYDESQFKVAKKEYVDTIKDLIE